MASASDIIGFCSSLLESDRFHDAAINGLQIEGSPTVRRVATAVSVNERVIRNAIEWNAEMLLVHHGLFWGEKSGPITGPLRSRLKLLLGADMTLAGYHLPLDAHPEIGNNALLTRKLGFEIVRPFAEVAGEPIGFIARSATPIAAGEIVQRLHHLTDLTPQVLTGGPETVERLAIVSGSGYSTLDEAASHGCQALITGDVREPTMALARELSITVIAGGHEATERLGIQALGEAVAAKFAIETRFFGDPNPI